MSRWPVAVGWLPALGAGLLLLPATGYSLQAQGVRFERTGFRMTSIGERITLSGRVLDSRRRPVAVGRVRFRVADPSIATVTPQGVVVSRKTGNTRLWAIAGNDSASALIVVDQWAAKFDFAPEVVRLDAVGARTPLRISVRDAEGHLITDQGRRAATCRSLNERVAVLETGGEVTARGNGTTYVRCVDRGIADSVRVDVRQRPARVTIADKANMATRIVGDTVRLRITALDRQGDAIAEPQSRWASLNPTIVSVDPVNGFARMLGGGTARIVVQVGDASDTATIGVAPGFGQAVPANADASAELDLTPRVPTLDIDPLIPREGDQATVTVRARDAQGNEVANAGVILRSSDTSVFVVEGGLRIRARKPGSAYVHGRFGVAFDSALVTVRSAAAVAAVEAAARPREPFVRPTFPEDSLRAIYRRDVDSVRNQMFRGSVVARGASGRMFSIDALGGTAAYTFADDSTGVEKRSGVIFGGVVEVAPFKWIRFGGDFKKGNLTATETLGNPAALTEASGHLTLRPFGGSEWFGLRAGYTLRALNDSLALQRWSIPSASVLIRLPFVGGQVTTLAGATVMAGTSYTGLANGVKPDAINLGGEAGIEFHTGWINAGLVYSVEGLGVDQIGRQDKFSSLRLRLGLQRGR